MMRCSSNVLHRLISSKDVAARLGVSQATVSRAVAKGLLHPALITPGGHRRFRSEDIEAFAAGLLDEPDGARLLTTGEAARLLGVSQPTLNRAVAAAAFTPRSRRLVDTGDSTARSSAPTCISRARTDGVGSRS